MSLMGWYDLYEIKENKYMFIWIENLQKNSQESPLPLGVGWIGKIIKK